MKKLLFLTCLLLLVACGHKKPPLAPTQKVDGKSIIVPPEFDVIPEVKSEK
ncbi:MAG: hypothetical protein IKQ99_02135 [Alphaproteobacteria bacterium]|nr:hypothetical protein [Alphaproteobacteria bacterium]